MKRIPTVTLLLVLFGIVMTACSLQSEETLAVQEQPETYTIEPIQCGIDAPSNGNRLVLFDDETNRLVGWSHIAAGRREFEKAKLDPVQYKIGVANNQVDPTCNNQHIFQTVLVKKYADWDRQHANGLEPQFLNEKISFGQVKEIVIELKVQSEFSSLLSPADLKTFYGDYLSDDELNELDQGKFNLGITLFEKGFDNQNKPSFTGSLIVEIDQGKYADQWIRLTIPAENLTYYEEENWSPTPANLVDFADNLILGLRINPETQSGKVVRNFIPEQYDNSVPEQLKEMSIAIKRLELRLR